MGISKRKDNLAEEKLKVIEQTDGQMCGDGNHDAHHMTHDH